MSMSMLKPRLLFMTERHTNHNPLSAQSCVLSSGIAAASWCFQPSLLFQYLATEAAID